MALSNITEFGERSLGERPQKNNGFGFRSGTLNQAKLSFELILAGFSQRCCSRFTSDVPYCHSELVLCKKPQRQGNTLNRHQSLLRSLDEEL